VDFYEDYYESISEDKKRILTSLKISTNEEKLNLMKNENQNKLNKLKLLLYQKFLNFLFSTLAMNIRKEFKTFMEKTKVFRLKEMGYKLESNDKVRNKSLKNYYLVILEI
jgi:hypothetical protein